VTVKKRHLERVKSSSIFGEIYGSDHCPVGVVFKLEDGLENGVKKEEETKEKI